MIINVIQEDKGMKSTGVVRKIDEMGRVVIPMEIRKTLDIKDGDSLEIFTDNDNIIFHKYQPSCNRTNF